MGMFDNLKCEMPLPGPGDKDTQFQTKDFEQTFGNYTIKQDGRIVRVCSVCGCLIPVHHHRSLNFYDVIDGEWVEYEARIIDSKVLKISTRATPENLEKYSNPV